MKKAWKPVEVNYVVFTGNENELKTLIGCANRSGDVDWCLGKDTNGNTVISGYNGYHHFSEIAHKGYYVVQCGNDIQVCNPKQFAAKYTTINHTASQEMIELLQDIVVNYQCWPNPAVMADKIEAVIKKARGEE